MFFGDAVAQWLRHCATNRKVAGSIQFAYGSGGGRLLGARLRCRETGLCSEGLFT
jgi:hypothetical protein